MNNDELRELVQRITKNSRLTPEEDQLLRNKKAEIDQFYRDNPFTCRTCRNRHDGEHLQDLFRRADACGMMALTEFEQHQVEGHICAGCVAVHPDGDGLCPLCHRSPDPAKDPTPCMCGYVPGNAG